MSTAAEQVRSSRTDARAFAEAFAEADDAFAFDARAGESRTLTLAELEDVLELSAPVEIRAARPAPARTHPAEDRAGDAGAASAHPEADEGLLTLAELGDALAGPAPTSDGLDFDFGSRTAERARRRTAARLGPALPRQRRVSGPAGRRGSGAADVHAAVPDRSADVLARGHTIEGVDGVAHAPRGSQDFVAAEELDNYRQAAAAQRTPAMAAPLAPPPPLPPRRRLGQRSSAQSDRRLAPTAGAEASSSPADPASRRPLPGTSLVQRARANPDRLALYAVLLGILLVLIAASSSASGAASLLNLQLS